MMRMRLSGLIAAPHTPFKADGGLNLSVVGKQVEWLVRQRVSGAFICGTTGEGLSLSKQERMELAEEWVRVAPKELPVIAHVGHLSLEEAKALAKHAQEIGAGAIGALGPFFYRPRTVDELVKYCSEIVAAAVDLPFYYYHLPSMTGVNLSMVEFMRAAKEQIATFAGIKYTHHDLMELRQCIEIAGDELDVLFGRDEMLLAGLAMGAKGAIGSTYNYAAGIYHRLMEAFSAGDLAAARKWQDQAVKLVQILRRYGEIAAAKVIMEMRGVVCGEPRLPLVGLSAEDRGRLRGEIDAMSVEEWFR